MAALSWAISGAGVLVALIGMLVVFLRWREAVLARAERASRPEALAGRNVIVPNLRTFNSTECRQSGTRVPSTGCSLSNTGLTITADLTSESQMRNFIERLRDRKAHV